MGGCGTRTHTHTHTHTPHTHTHIHTNNTYTPTSTIPGDGYEVRKSRQTVAINNPKPQVADRSHILASTRNRRIITYWQTNTIPMDMVTPQNHSTPDQSLTIPSSTSCGNASIHKLTYTVIQSYPYTLKQIVFTWQQETP
jgi:hypothetical protein